MLEEDRLNDKQRHKIMQQTANDSHLRNEADCQNLNKIKGDDSFIHFLTLHVTQILPSKYLISMRVSQLPVDDTSSNAKKIGKLSQNLILLFLTSRPKSTDRRIYLEAHTHFQFYKKKKNVCLHSSKCGEHYCLKRMGQLLNGDRRYTADSVLLLLLMGIFTGSLHVLQLHRKRYQKEDWKFFHCMCNV